MAARPHALASLALLLLLPAAADALPTLQVAEQSDDEAVVRLRVEDRTILGDTRSWCSVEVVVAGADVPFSEGDTYRVRVYENDLLGDDLLFEEELDVSAEEIAAQRIEKTFDCGMRIDGDPGDHYEVYADLAVRKDACGWDCWQDDPTTADLDMLVVEDDDDEDDDAENNAHAMGLGTTQDRIARDQDWWFVTLRSRSQLQVRVLHRPGAGRLDAVLFTEAGEQVANGEDREDGALLSLDELDVGTYRARVSPRGGNDYNFYDIDLFVETLAAECADGATEQVPCGNCGQRERACDPNGRWLPFGECLSEGECTPAETRTDRCDNCGNRLMTCTEGCSWAAGACEDQKECPPGAEDEQDCEADGQLRTRVCSDECAWGQYGDCHGQACDDGQRQACYSGPDGTAGKGPCKPGRQECANGSWGACTGEVLPAAESCADGVDNDCDGAVDGVDSDCPAGEGEGEGGGDEPRVGDACTGQAQCPAELECLTGSAHAVFTDGYCGRAGCAAACGADAPCATAFGRPYCLRACATVADCRRGQLCDDLGATSRVCVPKCRGDADCAQAAVSTCNVGTGRCEAPGGGGGPGDPPLSDPGGASDEGCDCSVGQAGSAFGGSRRAPALGLWGLLTGLALRRVRRRRQRPTPRRARA